MLSAVRSGRCAAGRIRIVLLLIVVRHTAEETARCRSIEHFSPMQNRVADCHHEPLLRSGLIKLSSFVRY